MRPNYWYRLGEFLITPFRTEHDSTEPLGFLIEHPEAGKVLFITDSAFVKPNFKNLAANHILCEANYSIDIANQHYAEGTLERSRLDRLLKTHMEIQTAKEFVKSNMTPALDSILLLHLSDGNSNSTEFQRTIQEVVGEKVSVRIADKNLTYSLDICPF